MLLPNDLVTNQKQVKLNSLERSSIEMVFYIDGMRSFASRFKTEKNKHQFNKKEVSL